MRFGVKLRSAAWAAALLIGISAILAAAPQKHSKTSKKEKAQITHRLRSRLSKVRQSRAVVRHELNKTVRAEAGVSDQIDQVDSNLSDLADQLVDTQQRLDSHRKRQSQLKKELVQTQFELSGQTADMRRRLRAMYEEGDQPLASVLMGSASTGDLADRAYLIKRVATANSDAIHAYQAKVARYQADKAEEDRLVTSIAAEVQAEADQRAKLQAAREQKQNLYDQLDQKKDSLQHMMDQMAADEASIQSEITEAERQDTPAGGKAPAKFGGKLIWPCHGPITSPFGMRYHPILHRERMHTGMDIGVPYGTPIHAAAAGVVISAKYMNGYGNTVIIDHGGGIATVYGHNEKLLVHSGEHVDQGQTIALAGATGLATGPHCHFEVRVNGHPVNPRGYLH